MVSLTCAACATQFEKKNNEYNRLVKKGRERFYCSLRCSGKDATGHFSPEWNNSPENFRNLRDNAWSGRPLEERPFYEHVRRCRTRCKKSKKDLDIDVEYLIEIWGRQNGHCALTNIPLVHGGQDINVQASLDRKDSSKGYIRGNVQFVCTAINYAKSTKTDDSVHEFISLIVKNRQS